MSNILFGLDPHQIVTAASLLDSLQKHDREYAALKKAKTVRASADGDRESVGSFQVTRLPHSGEWMPDQAADANIILQFLLKRKRKAREDVARRLRQLNVFPQDLEP